MVAGCASRQPRVFPRAAHSEMVKALNGPVEEPEGPRIAMKMMLGLLVIKQRLFDCGINFSLHGRDHATIAAGLRRGWPLHPNPRAKSSMGGFPLRTSGFPLATWQPAISRTQVPTGCCSTRESLHALWHSAS